MQYADTAIIQSGSQITDAKVVLDRAEQVPIQDDLAFYEGRNPALKAHHDDLLKKYGMTRTDKVWINYGLELSVEPLAPGQPARPPVVK